MPPQLRQASRTCAVALRASSYRAQPKKFPGAGPRADVRPGAFSRFDRRRIRDAEAPSDPISWRHRLFVAMLRFRTQRFRNRLRQKAELMRRLNLIWAVQPLVKKFSALVVGQIIFTSSPVSRPSGGAFGRSSRTLGAGCGGRFGVARRAILKWTAKSCGSDAPTLASSR